MIGKIWYSKFSTSISQISKKLDFWGIRAPLLKMAILGSQKAKIWVSLLLKHKNRQISKTACPNFCIIGARSRAVVWPNYLGLGCISWGKYDNRGFPRQFSKNRKTRFSGVLSSPPQNGHFGLSEGQNLGILTIKAQKSPNLKNCVP